MKDEMETAGHFVSNEIPTGSASVESSIYSYVRKNRGLSERISEENYFSLFRGENNDQSKDSERAREIERFTQYCCAFKEEDGTCADIQRRKVPLR